MSANSRNQVAVISPEELRELVSSTILELLDGFQPSGSTREVMSRAEAAEFLRCSLPQLDRMVRLQSLPFHLLGDSRRFLRSELIGWLRGGCPSQGSSKHHSPKEPESARDGHSRQGTEVEVAKITNDSALRLTGSDRWRLRA